MKKFKPSKYQQQVFDFIDAAKGSAVVEAVAGSGKTTTIVEALGGAKGSVTFLAFNRSIVAELGERLPEGTTAKTLNGLGHGAVLKHLGRRVKPSTTIDRDRLRACDLSGDTLSDAVRVLGLAKANGLAPSGCDAPGALGTLDTDAIQFIADHAGIYLNGEFNKAADAIKAAARSSLEPAEEISFDDQLYIPVLKQANMWRNDWLFVDEAQDLSPIQHALVARAMKSDGHLVAVGDSRQAIYAFRGAASDSMDRIRKAFNAVSLPLSISYRCPKAVVALAKSIVPQIESHENAPDGVVEKLGVKWSPHDLRPGDMVVCRNNKPLVKLLYQLLGAKVPATIRGRDIGRSLASMLRKRRAPDLVTALGELRDWQHAQCAKLLARDAEDAAQSLVDKVDAIYAFADGSSATTVAELCAEIESMFSDSTGQSLVTLSSVHRAKGLEANRVWLLDADELMPSKWAKTPEQKQQEQNLIYVAITRAKQELRFIDSQR